MTLAQGVSVVVPCYRSALTLRELVDRLCAVLSRTGTPFEIILVDDGSGDSTWSTVQELARGVSVVRGIALVRNYGQHNALLAGIRAAGFSTCVTLDDDLQNPPEEIPRLLQALECGWDVVYGTPAQGQHGALRNCASWITKQALRVSMNTPIATKISAFRAFRTRLRESFDTYHGAWVSIDVLLAWGTQRFGSISVSQSARQVGESGYSVWKLFVHATNMVTGFSVVPLRLATLIGLIFGCLGMVSLAYVLVRYALVGGAVPGFAFLACALSIFSGVQLMVIGVMGEYLGRVFVHVSGRPSYTVAENIGVECARP